LAALVKNGKNGAFWSLLWVLWGYWRVCDDLHGHEIGLKIDLIKVVWEVCDPPLDHKIDLSEISMPTFGVKIKLFKFRFCGSNIVFLTYFCCQIDWRSSWSSKITF
jgi:hypothetical protein